MNKQKLIELYEAHTEKASHKWFLYLTKYDYLFDYYREKPIKLLEVGVQNGGSLEIWSKYFKNSSILVGCDINPACSKLKYEDKRIKVVIGDIDNNLTQEKILKHSPLFDIIIDDGSHLSGDIIRTFSRYLSSLSDGGIYIVEDLHCSYWEQYEGGLFNPYSSMSFFKQLADVINHEHWGLQKQRNHILKDFFTVYDFNISNELLERIHSVEFINSICIIRKAAPEKNILNHHVIAGLTDDIQPGQLELNKVSYELPLSLHQKNNQWDNVENHLEKNPNDFEIKISKLNQTLAQNREHIEKLNQNISQLEYKINALYKSLSWLITKPLRIIMGFIRHSLKNRERNNFRSRS